MMHSHIDPKDYPSYEDYLIALQVHDEFLDLSQKVTQAVNESETEEEYERRMAALGFTKHEDPLCGNDFCNQSEICLWIVLESFQEDCRERFFEDLLAEKDWIFSYAEIENYLQYGCKLPASWVKEAAMEHQSICFVMDLEAAIYESRPEKTEFGAFITQEEVKSVFRQLYLFLLIQLRQPESVKKAAVIKKLEAFLRKNSLLDKGISKEFLGRLDGFI